MSISDIVLSKGEFDSLFLSYTRQSFARYPIYKDKDDNLYLLQRVNYGKDLFKYEGIKITMVNTPKGVSK